MANPFQAEQQGPAGIKSLQGKFQHDPNQEYRSFQVRANEPDARALERYVFDVSREYGQHPMNIDIGLHSNWEERQGSSMDSAVHPFYPLNVSNTRKIDPVTNTDARGDYTDYLYNRLYQNEINKKKQGNTIQAGITNPNLGGARVMNAMSIDPSADDFFLRELFNYGKRYFPGYDAEQDEWRQKKYRDSLEEEEFEILAPELQAGTTEDKWGQLVRDGIVNPGDNLNHLEIDRLYNQYYEGGAGDMDQFGVAQSRWKEKGQWDIMIQNLIDRGIVQDEKEGNTYMFEKTGQSKPMPVTVNRGGLISLI